LKKIWLIWVLLTAAILLCGCVGFRSADDGSAYTPAVVPADGSGEPELPELPALPDSDSLLVGGDPEENDAVKVPAPAESVTEPESAPESEPAPEPESEEIRISFLAAGDNVIHPCIYLEAAKRATADTRPYNFKPMYADIIDLVKSYDLAFINQETLMGGADLGYSGYPQFNSPQDLGLDLVEMGFDIVSIANNHMADKGDAGLRGTIEFWNEIGAREDGERALMIGGYLDEEDYDTVRVIEANGIDIAFLAYTYGTNGLSLPSKSELVVPYINDDDIRRQTALAKEAGDMVIVSIHWGVENTFTPTDEQRRVAALLAECGVDVILGHHPHVLQPIEWIEREGDSPTLCIYSLGNLVSAMMYSENMVGGFLTFDIAAKGDKITVENVRFLPTVFYYAYNYFSTHLYMMEDFTEELASVHGTSRYGNLATVEQLRGFVKKVIAEEYLPDYLKE